VTRQAPGRGTIRQRASGRFEGRYYTTAGKQRSVYGATRAETADKLETALQNAAMGIEAAGPRLTVATYLRDWLSSRKEEVAPSTLRRYQGICEVNLIPAIGAMPLTNLSGVVVERMLAEAAKNGLSPQTVGHVRAVLRTALNRAVRHGMIARNAAADAYPPRIRHRARPILDDAQLRELLAGLEDERLRALYVLAISTGMREGELLGLRWCDIDLDAGVVRVNAQLQRIDGRLKLVQTKTEASQRVVGIGEVVASILRGHRATQLRERLVAGDLWFDADFVFARPNGQPLYAELVIKQ
jgi:integrase